MKNILKSGVIKRSIAFILMLAMLIPSNCVALASAEESSNNLKSVDFKCDKKSYLENVKKLKKERKEWKQNSSNRKKSKVKIFKHPKIKIEFNTNDFSYDDKREAYVVDTEIITLSGTLENKSKIKQYYFELTNENEELVQTGEIEPNKDWTIETALLENKLNYITVYAVAANKETASESLAIYCNTDDDDDDGISDEYELKTIYPYLLFSGKGEDITDVTQIGTEDDYDKDGLTTLEEYILGTDVGVADTDGDGLSDYDEVYKYGTNPLDYDTDCDGMGDGVEIINGLDPLNQDTDNDGVLDDAEVIENQELISSIYDGININKTHAMPEIKINGSGDYSSKIVIEHAEYDTTYSKLNYLVSGVIDIRHPESMQYDSAQVSFKLADDVLKSNDIEDLSIVRLDKSRVIPIKTTIDKTTNTITAKVDELCKYAVENKSLRESDTEINNIKSIIEKGRADVVFILDTTGSMGWAISNVKNNLNKCAELLSEKNLDVRYGLVEYKDIYDDGKNSTKKHGWFTDVTKFKSAINNLSITGGGDYPESVVDALEKTRELDFRNGYNKYAILVTDATYKNGTTTNGSLTMDEMIKSLVEDEINVSVVANSNLNNTYKNLYGETGGIFTDISTNFYDSISPLIEKMDDEVNEDGYKFVRLADYQIVKVATDAETDTDGDGLPDQLELGAVIDTDYDEYGNVIEVVEYRSNPTVADSDGDGLNDAEDPRPLEYDVVVKRFNDESNVVYLNTGKSFGIRFNEKYTINDFLDEYRTRYLRLNKAELETIKWGLDLTIGFDFDMNEYACMGYIDDGQMKYCVQDKDFLFKDKLFTIMTGSEYKAKEKTIKIPFYGDYTYITSDNVSEYFKLATPSGAWIRYFSTTIKQMVLGKWSKDSNAIGVIGEIGVAFTGLDIAQDVRDLAHDVTHFEASWSWVGETALDGVSLIPVIGALSKVDEASFFIKHSDDLMEVRTVAKLNGTVFEAAKRVTSKIDNLTSTAKAAIEKFGKSVDATYLFKSIDSLKTSGLRDFAFATYGDNDLVEIFLKNDDFVKNASSIEPTAVQIAYRKTVMEATDPSGNIIKKNDEIIEAANKNIDDAKDLVENGEEGLAKICKDMPIVDRIKQYSDSNKNIKACTTVTGVYSDTMQKSKILRSELYKNGITPPPYKNAAHHIVAVNDKGCETAREILNKFGIDVNSSANGVLLPMEKNSYVRTEAMHVGGHSNDYYEEVTMRLQDASENIELAGLTCEEGREYIVGVLDNIRQDLLNGKLKINSK